VRGVKDGPELSWVREARVDVTYTNGGGEDTFADPHRPGRALDQREAASPESPPT
jgi:hypothetical protein